jgi:hypothetical protein
VLPLLDDPELRKIPIEKLNELNYSTLSERQIRLIVGFEEHRMREVFRALNLKNFEQVMPHLTSEQMKYVPVFKVHGTELWEK